MKKIKRFFALLLVLFVVFSGVQIYAGYDKFQDALLDVPLSEKIEEIREKSGFTPYEDISETYFKAVIAVEDRRFYSHSGFDPVGIVRAIVNDLKAKKLLEGGSTITQQLAKNLYFPLDSTLTRKIAELFMAYHIESQCTKEEILELYANAIYFGSGYYCIRDASHGYFEKLPALLDVDECAMLAGIPNAPSVYSPDVNPELAEQRQAQVLEAMAECGYLEQD